MLWKTLRRKLQKKLKRTRYSKVQCLCPRPKHHGCHYERRIVTEALLVKCRSCGWGEFREWTGKPR